MGTKISRVEQETLSNYRLMMPVSGPISCSEFFFVDHVPFVIPQPREKTSGVGIGPRPERQKLFEVSTADDSSDL